MGILAKKINIKKNTVVQQATLYSTLSEVGNTDYINLTVDGVTAYAKYGATNDPRATNGRIDIKETTYALLSMAIPPYGSQTYIASGYFTVPAGCSKLRITCVGGGGGGGQAVAHATAGYSPVTYIGANGGTGGTSSVGALLSCVGGGGGGGGSLSDLSCWGGAAGTGGGNNGYAGIGSYGLGGYGMSDYTGEGYVGGAGGENGANGVAGRALNLNGTAGHRIRLYTSGGGGGGGRSVRNILVTVTAGTQYYITIGGGGYGSGNVGGIAGQAGQKGYVLIEWGLGVE